MKYIIFLLSQFDQAIIQVFLLHQIATPKKRYIPTMLLWFALFVTAYIVFEIMGDAAPPDSVKSVVQISLQIPVLCLYSDRLRKKIAMFFSNLVYQMFVETATLRAICVVFGVSLDEFYDFHTDSIYMSIGRLIVVDVMVVMLIPVILLYRRHLLKDRFFCRQMTLLAGFAGIHAAFLFAYYRINLHTLSVGESVLQFTFQSLFLVILFFHYFHVQKSHQLMEEEQELRIIQSCMENDYQYYQLADSKFTEISQLRHDIQNQFQAVRFLWDSPDGRSQAESILGEVQEQLNAAESTVYCGSHTMNAVLSVKIDDKKMQGIRMEIDLHDCEELPFEDYNLCSLVSNLLDRAAENCLRSGDSSGACIALESAVQGDRFVLRCTSPCGDTAEDGGWGRAIIERICRKYRGACSGSTENGMNVMTVSLLLEAGARQ